MAKVIYEIPVEMESSLEKYAREKLGYTDLIEGENGASVPNPQTAFQYLAESVASEIYDNVVAHITEQAKRQAESQVRSSVVPRSAIVTQVETGA